VQLYGQLAKLSKGHKFMRKLLVMFSLLALVACGKNDTVTTPDHKGQIDDNTARIELLEANDAVQDLRLDSIEAMLADLDLRVTANENSIDANEEDISELFDLVEGLDDELSDLRSELRYEVRQLRKADRKTRKLIRKKVRNLRRKLSREVRQRQLADANLQDQIDDLELDLNQFESRQRFFNYIMAGALAGTNYRITLLQLNIQFQLRRIDRRLDVLESDVSDIKSDIVSLQNQVDSIQSQIDTLENEVVSVVYPCGEGNSEEVLLETKDGLVAYFQSTRNQTVNFSDSITIDAYTIPAHTDKYCEDTNFFNGECNDYSYRHVGEHTIPSQSFSVNDSASIKVINKAYLDVLADGNYRTTDGFSCNFTISNGEVL
jgi:predicted  nucleic acid-binding Zn-ribbon protein